MQCKAIGPDKIATSVKLTERINSGGEGHIYATDRADFVAKVYRTGHITENKYLKCNWFVNKQIHYDGICLPTHLLADENGNFVGYLMPRALGDTVASIIHPVELKEKHPELNRVHLANLCVSLLEQIKYLHDNGVLICDLDLQNILVDNLYSTHPKTFIIDCDSFQIGVGHAMQYPGDVGRPLTTPPELQGVPFEEQHRTFSNEYFSIAVMLFKILLPNQSPYMIKGGANDEIALVREGNFPYTKRPFDIDDIRDQIPGNWAADAWKHLPTYITELFWDNLNKSGRYYAAADRSNVKDWLLIMRRYRDELISADPESEMIEIFPLQSLLEEQQVTESKLEDDRFDDSEISVESIIQDFQDKQDQEREAAGLGVTKATRAKLQLDKKAKMFEKLSQRLNDDDVLFICIGVAFVLTYILYAIDPMSLITKVEYSSFPPNVLVFLAFSFFPMLIIYAILLGPVLAGFGGWRENHYSKLARNARLGKIFKDGKIMDAYIGEPKPEKWYLTREYVVIGIVSVIWMIIAVLLVYHGIGWLSTVLG